MLKKLILKIANYLKNIYEEDIAIITKSKIGKKYTWKPDVPDFRDQKFTITSPVKLPKSVDLSSGNPNVYDQGQLGSCTANSLSGSYDFERIKQKLAPLFPSRLFVYYNERLMEGTVSSDSGAQIRDGIKVLASQGVCPEKEWPYDTDKFTVKPSDACYKDASANTIKQYLRLDNTDIKQLKTCLAQGYTFVFGFTVYESFEGEDVASSGIVPMPDGSEQCMGGHAVYCVGYDDSKGAFKVRNSWGPNWGDGGNFWLPYEYMTNADLANDFWTIRLV